MHVALRQAYISNPIVLGMFIYELLVLSVVFWIGRIRGWSFAKLGFQISWKWTGVGVLLFVVSEAVAHGLFRVLAHVIHSEAGTVGLLAGGLTLPFIILNSITNPVFEEVFEAGYFIHSLQRFGMWPAVLASALFRAFLHAHLGVNGQLCVFVLGVIFGLTYWRWRQLWPLIFAHSLVDFIGKLYLSHHAA